MIMSENERKDLEIYDREFREWLPKEFFDAHVHIFDETNFPPGFELSEKRCFNKFGGTFTIEQWRAIIADLLPEQECSLLCFGTPDKAADLAAADKYIGSIVDNERIFGMTLLSPKENIDEVRRRVEEYNLIGYKPYLNFVDWKPVNEVEIFDMLTDEQMSYADERGLVVTLHIPRSGRLADSVNQRQMVQLCDRYPNAKIIFAHIGRAYFMNNVIGNLAEIAKRPNAYIDTAMINHEGILEYAFNNFPRERILFGSDAPIAFLRGKSVEINNQYAYLMAEDYRIGTAIYDSEKVVNFTTFFYEQLRGVKTAAERAAVTKKELRGIFHDNAMNLFYSS
jgi:predicted TIM-barrel fold metal-dependent hydrolase